MHLRAQLLAGHPLADVSGFVILHPLLYLPCRVLFFLYSIHSIRKVTEEGYDREMALVADYQNPQTEEHELLAIGRLSKLHGTNEAEFAMLVSDRYQCQGLGTELLKRLLQVGRDEQLTLISAEILAENSAMQRVCQKLSFCICPTADASVVRALYDIKSG